MRTRHKHIKHKLIGTVIAGLIVSTPVTAEWNWENAWPSKVSGPAPKADDSIFVWIYAIDGQMRISQDGTAEGQVVLTSNGEMLTLTAERGSITCTTEGPGFRIEGAAVISGTATGSGRFTATASRSDDPSSDDFAVGISLPDGDTSLTGNIPELPSDLC